MDSYCSECGSPVLLASDPAQFVAAAINGPPPLQPARAHKSLKAARNVVLGLLLIVVLAATGFLAYTITRPDPNGYYGFDPSSSARALYYMRKEVRGVVAERGVRHITFCDGGNVTRPGAFVYLLSSCFEYDDGRGRFRVPFFVQMERTPPDGQTYSLVQFKVGQSGPVTAPMITDGSGRTAPVLRAATVGSLYSVYLNAVGGYTLPNLNSVSTRPSYGCAQPNGSLPPGLTGKVINSPCIQNDMEHCALLISGTPTQAGIFTFTEQVTDYNGKTSNSRHESFSIIVSENGTGTSDTAHTPGPENADCLSYGPAEVKLTGIISPKTFPGPPNYESVAKGDQAERVWVLRVDQPICTTVDTSDESNGAENNITELQLLFTGGQEYDKYRPLLAKRVNVRGTLHHAETGHHHTTVMLGVNRIESD